MNRTLVLLALLAVGSEARAQCLLYGWPIPQASQVLTAGDVDLDGTPDFLVPCPGSTLQGLIGRVHVRSGRTGAELLVVTGGLTPDGFGGRAVALGDVDQDGHSDFAVSAAASYSTVPSYVRVYSGATGAVIWEVDQTHYPLFLLGRALARVADLDQDGISDLVVGTPAYATGNGHVFVLSGANGSLVLDLSATPGITVDFGTDVASAADLDRDGREDVLVADTGGAAGPGRVTVHSGRTGQVLLSVTLAGFHYQYGLHPATLGDVSGDGIVDYAIGCPSQVITPGATSGRLRIVSGADGSELLLVDAAPGEQAFADSVDRISDHDGDGLADVLITAGFRVIGCCAHVRNDVRVLSSATGATLVSGQFVGVPKLEVLPDADGNGLEDIGIPGALAADGVVCGVVLSGVPLPSVVTACVAKTSSQGCRPELRASGAPSPTMGHDLVFQARHVVPNMFGVLVGSTLGAITPFAGGRLCVAAPIRRLGAATSGSGTSDGACNSAPTSSLTWTLSKSDVAALGVPPGGTYHVQAWFRDPGFAAPNDVGLSDSLLVTIWP